jgi:hypothetical protein
VTPDVATFAPGDAPPTIATQASSTRDRRIAFALVAALSIVSVLASPFRSNAFGAVASFIPAFAGTTGLADLLTAALLFGLYRVEGSRMVLAVAGAYLLNAFVVVPYALTFPGVVTADGFFGNEQSAAWLWLTWHASFPLIALAGFLPAARDRAADDGARAAAVFRAIALCAAGAASATLAVADGRNHLPALVHQGHFSALFTDLAVVAAFINAVAACVVTLRSRPAPTMHLWVIVAFVASALDCSLNGLAPSRYSLVWYVGKSETFVTAAVVLVSLLAAWSSMYARTIALTGRLLQTTAERRSLEDRLARERQISMMLQEASLTRRLPASPLYRFDAAYHPGRDEATIGGDWYDAFALPDGRIAITIGDVMGSGILAAVTMTKLRGAMQAAAMIDPTPATMLDVADRTLHLHDPGGYATALAMIFDPVAQEATFASAGHFAPLVRCPDGSVCESRSFGTLLGLGLDEPRETATIAMRAGTVVALYTDGIVEVTRDLLAGQRRLSAALADPAIVADVHPAQALVERVLGGFHATDDIAVLLLEVKAVSAAANAGAACVFPPVQAILAGPATSVAPAE